MRSIYKGNIVFIGERKILEGEVWVEDGKIKKINTIGEENSSQPYILPGFIDSHVHIESSMLVPSEFAKMAVVHGTVATISDPHEIANVCGMEGVEYMIENAKTVPFKFHFGAPSCVPATTFETAGSLLGVDEVTILLQSDDIFYLSEMMNFPGVLHNDPEVMAKIAAAKDLHKPVDGHAPGLRGDAAKRYIDAGISTDHECFTAEEALEKLRLGMKIIIREGSAAKNFDALIPLLDEHYNNMFFCSDDKHPDSLLIGHINALCARAVALGNDIFKVLRVACINPVKHYQMKVGLLQEGDDADFTVVKNLKEFEVLQTFIQGIEVAANGTTKIVTTTAPIINRFNCLLKNTEDFKIPVNLNEEKVIAIEAIDGQLITNKLESLCRVVEGNKVSNTFADTLKIAVVNRYADAPVAKAFIKNFGLKKGAIASSVAHDSHNIVAVGVSDEQICKAVNLVIEKRGGICAVNEDYSQIIALPVAGLMSNEDGTKIANDYTSLDNYVKAELGSTLQSPFMTLSFMALLVIPSLKLSDKGLFDGDKFEFISEP